MSSAGLWSCNYTTWKFSTNCLKLLTLLSQSISMFLDMASWKIWVVRRCECECRWLCGPASWDWTADPCDLKLRYRREKKDKTTLAGRCSRESGLCFRLGSEAKTIHLHQERDQRVALLLGNDFIWSPRQSMWDKYQKRECAIRPSWRTHTQNTHLVSRESRTLSPLQQQTQNDNFIFLGSSVGVIAVWQHLQDWLISHTGVCSGYRRTARSTLFHYDLVTKSNILFRKRIAAKTRSAARGNAEMQGAFRNRETTKRRNITSNGDED